MERKLKEKKEGQTDIPEWIPSELGQVAYE